MPNFEKVIVIIPTYNEKNNIFNMLATIHQKFPTLHVLIIDDASPDGTAQIVKNFQRDKSNLHLIEREGKLGLGGAYLKGFKWVLQHDYEVIVTLDCDFSHDPGAIPSFIEKIGEYDLVVGSRYKDGVRILNWNMSRLLLSYFATKYVKIITALPFSDSTSGFNAYSRKALSNINLENIFSVGYAFQIELKYKIWSLGLPCVEIPIIFSERNFGKSKMSNSIILEAIFTVFRLRIKKIFGVL